jgi:hypothetical protein
VIWRSDATKTDRRRGQPRQRTKLNPSNSHSGGEDVHEGVLDSGVLLYRASVS